MNSGDAAGVVIGLIFGILGIYIAYILYKKYSQSQYQQPVAGSLKKMKSVRLSVTSGLSPQHANYEVVNPMFGHHEHSHKRDIESNMPQSNRTHQLLNDTEALEDNIDISTENYLNYAAGSSVSHDEEPESYENVQISGIIKSGYLYKKSTSIKKDWLRRWFFIKEGKLFYCHVESDVLTTSTTQAVQIANLVISTVKEISKKEFRIISPGSRGSNKGGGTYDLQTETEEDAKDWVRVIRSQIEGSLTQTIKSEDTTTAQGSSSSVFIVPNDQDLRELSQINPYCADCGSTENVTWASLNLCVMICIECSGIHRSLGTHISKVRSLTLDKWSIYSLELMKTITNSKANMIWEGSMSPSYKINHDSSREQRESYINDKYVKKLYLAATIRSVDIDNLALRSAATGKVFNLMQAVAAGADLHTTWHTSEVDTKKTPLHMACEGEFILCVELLCLNNAAVDVKDFDDKLPIEIARQHNRADIVDLLAFYTKS
jgi:hypothetical protein